MRGASRFPTYVGRILIVVGFIMILVAWNGAAELDYIQGQFPYLLSGAMPGLAVIIVGAGLEYVQLVRQVSARRAKQMAELNVNVRKLIGFVKETGGLIPGPDAETTTDHDDVEARLAGLDASGHALDSVRGGTATAVAPTRTTAEQTTAEPDAQPDPQEARVVAGRSSFHDPSCHLVTGREDMAEITRLEAEGQGLSPCRVCKP